MSKVLIGLTGSIACFKVAGIISELAQNGHEVRTIATDSALKFIGKATLEGLSGNNVHTKLFADDENMEHIHLGRWADLFLIAPCTANTMAKLKVGLADDLLTNTALAFEKTKPIYIAPAMNKEMWSHAATQESYNVLSERGYRFIEPEAGNLACGEVGSGRLAESGIIMSTLFPKNEKRILVTGGGTREPIDGVRFIGNSSTGKTSRILSEQLAAMGHSVDLLSAQTSFKDFENRLRTLLSENKYDAVIHAAAVSDYSVDKITSRGYEGQANEDIKLKTGDHLNIQLKPNPKLINSIKDWSINKDVRLIGFKLTNTEKEAERQEAIDKLFNDSPADFIVHNDLNEISENQHIFRIQKGKETLSTADGAQSLAREISQLLGGAL